MKKGFVFVFCLVATVINAQWLEFQDTLDFGTVDETNAVTKELRIINHSTLAINISDLDLFEVYGNSPFTVTDTSDLLFPGDTFKTSVSFLPEHNIKHEMALVIKTSSGLGHGVVTLLGQGHYSNSYYNSTENKSEEALKLALKSRLAQGYSQLSYNVARDNMYGSIDNVAGDVECVYTGRTATFNTRAGANNNSFNCEHTFPQGFFNQNLPMRSDIHHLFPTDVSANSTRGNNPFGVVTSASWQVGGSKSGGGVFEPRNIHKGTCARAMMYFVIRYQDYSNHFAGQETVLRQWHNQYPPTVNDNARNVAIESIQNNRNPFIDYPQFEERITNFVSNSTVPAVSSLYFSDDTIRLLSDVSIVAAHNFRFVVYNSGNEVVELDNFNLTGSNLQFVPGFPSDITILPGKSAHIDVVFNPNTNYSGEWLTFDTDISGMSNVNIPFSSSVTIGLGELSGKGDSYLYPNPAREWVSLNLEGSKVKDVFIYDLLGQEHPIKERTGKQINISHLPSGLYMVKIETYYNESLTQKLLVH